MRAVAFDLGDTLVEYEGLPLSWENYYAEALGVLAAHLGVEPAPADTERAVAVLRRHNTRIAPRIEEIAWEKIFAELSEILEASGSENTDAGARAFFRIFRQRLRCFSDAPLALRRLRSAGVPAGIFTDVPYGMPRSLVEEDIFLAGLDGLFDVLVTSVDAGFRKPSPEALRYLARRMSCDPSEMSYVGNERKDIDAAKACGCRAILLDRSLQRPDWGQDETIATLDEVCAD